MRREETAGERAGARCKASRKMGNGNWERKEKSEDWATHFPTIPLLVIPPIFIFKFPTGQFIRLQPKVASAAPNGYLSLVII